MMENAFVTDQCTKFIFALLLCCCCFFNLIRTQAFSVFSEVSCGGGAAVRQNNTQMSGESENGNCVNKGVGLWMTLCSFLVVTFTISLFRVHLFYLVTILLFFLIYSSVVHRLTPLSLTRGGAMHRCDAATSSVVHSKQRVYIAKK